MSTPPKLGLREARKRRTHAELEAAAVKLFLERGYANTTVEDIAEAAAVSTRTFFRYFASKEAVFDFQDDELLERLQTCMASRPSDEEPIALVASTIVAFAGSLDEEDYATLQRRAAVLVANDELAGRRLILQDTWATGLAEALARHQGKQPDVAYRVLAKFGIAVLAEAMYSWHDSGFEGSVADYVQNCFDVFAETVGARVPLYSVAP